MNLRESGKLGRALRFGSVSLNLMGSPAESPNFRPLGERKHPATGKSFFHVKNHFQKKQSVMNFQIKRTAPTFTERDLQGYSLCQLVDSLASNRGPEGIAKEVNQEMTRVNGVAPGGGTWIPSAVFRKLEVATATLGGNLKATNLLGDEFIDMLRPRSVVLRAGGRTVPGLIGDTVIPRQKQGATAQWAVSESALVTASNLTFDQLTLSPKELTALVQVSNKLMVQSTPSVEAIVRDDLMKQIAAALDRAALHGAGSGGEPSGVFTTEDIQRITAATDGVNFTTWGVTAYASMVSLEATVSVANADLSRCSWITSPQVRGQLRQSPLASNEPVFVWSDARAPGLEMGDGLMLGYAARPTTNVSTELDQGSASGVCSCVFFGDFSSILLGEWGNGLSILVDPYVNANVRQTNIYATLLADIGVRQPESLGVLQGIVVS